MGSGARRRPGRTLLDAAGGALVLTGALMLVAGPLQAGLVAPASSAASPPAIVAMPVAAPADEPGTIATGLRIARLGIDVPIVAGDGVTIPTDAAAHFPGTGWPGGGASIYLYAHARTGLFIDLWKARDGDVIDLALSDGHTAIYQVTDIKPLVPWDDLEYLQPDGTERLVLQTCLSGDPHAPRFIVIAQPYRAAA